MTTLARTTLDLPAPLMREIKSRAALSGVSMKDFLAQLLQNALQEPATKKAVSAKRHAAPDWMAHVGTLAGSSALSGDPVAIQRKMRSEWQRKPS
jgi:hypothetical protein